jgi:DNA-binding transcriptional MerR regulator
MKASGLFIGGFAEQVGMAPSALCYYEKAGLLQAEARTAAGYRLYGWRAAYRVRFIQRAQLLGLKLSEIKQLVDTPRGTREDERARFSTIIAAKVMETRSRKATLRATERRQSPLSARRTAAAAAMPPRRLRVLAAGLISSRRRRCSAEARL